MLFAKLRMISIRPINRPSLPAIRVVALVVCGLTATVVQSQEFQSAGSTRQPQMSSVSSNSVGDVSNRDFTTTQNESVDTTTRLASLPFQGPLVAQPLEGIRSNGPIADDFQLMAVGQNNRGSYIALNAKGKLEIKSDRSQTILYHQPLVQVKLRIAEIVREDNFAAKTVLDFVRSPGKTSLVGTHTVNAGQGATTSTRFSNTAALVGPENLGGNGGLINLTSRQLNLIGEFLATEFSADLVTCPQVVTLNGQTVQLLAGANVPFTLGQSVLQDGTLSVQETFYKHVGTNLTVTPRIVNWGPRGEGGGESPIMTHQVKNWNALAGMMSREELLQGDNKTMFAPYVDTSLLMPTKEQATLLRLLNARSKNEIIQLLISKQTTVPNYPYCLDALFFPLDCQQLGENGCPCQWNAADCTIDVELVLRQSKTADAQVADLKLATPVTASTTRSVTLTSEEVGAAIANIVQVKSGQGAVIAGLIGERDVKSISKIPVLGDIPWIGAAFRSKNVNRQKTEIVIFLEAEVLPSDQCAALAQASTDFPLTQPYLSGDVLSNPLEAGLQRVGVGSYLPPRTSHEKVYWERLGRKVQKSSADTHDILR